MWNENETKSLYEDKQLNLKIVGSYVKCLAF